MRKKYICQNIVSVIITCSSCMSMADKMNVHRGKGPCHRPHDFDFIPAQNAIFLNVNNIHAPDAQNQQHAVLPNNNIPVHLNPQGIAFEVHNYSGTIVPTENITVNDAVFNYIKSKLSNLVNPKNINYGECILLLKKEIDAYARIAPGLKKSAKDKLIESLDSDDKKNKLVIVMNFVNQFYSNKMDIYIKTFVDEFVTAYPQYIGTGKLSCVKGIIERIFTSLRSLNDPIINGIFKKAEAEISIKLYYDSYKSFTGEDVNNFDSTKIKKIVELFIKHARYTSEVNNQTFESILKEIFNEEFSHLNDVIEADVNAYIEGIVDTWISHKDEVIHELQVMEKEINKNKRDNIVEEEKSNMPEVHLVNEGEFENRVDEIVAPINSSIIESFEEQLDCNETLENKIVAFVIAKLGLESDSIDTNRISYIRRSVSNIIEKTQS